MKKLMTAAVIPMIGFCLSLFSGTSARADNFSPTYNMFGTVTELNDMDVDYDFATPIQLIRTSHTFRVHEIRFNVMSYEEVCVSYERVCVAQDSHGRCTQWENRCVQTDYRATPVEKQIELDFTKLPAVPTDKEEVYEITINRMKPAGDGEDWVTTSLRAVSTQAPVKVVHWSDFNYQISPGQP